MRAALSLREPSDRPPRIRLVSRQMKLSAPVRAQYELQCDGSWLASLRDDPAVCVTGRSLDNAEARLRAAAESAHGLSVTTAGWSRAYPGLPVDMFDTVIAARARIQEAQQAASSLLQQMVRRLSVEFHLSTRDIARLLHISHQRVSQLLRGTEQAELVSTVPDGGSGR